MKQKNYLRNFKNNLVIRIFGYSDICSPGYIAISSILVIAAVVLIIGTTVALVSINEGQMSLAAIQSDTALGIVEGCTEEALLFLNENNTLPATITVPLGSCTATTNSVVGTTWTITISTTVNTFTKSVQIILTRGSTITISSWSEI